MMAKKQELWGVGIAQYDADKELGRADFDALDLFESEREAREYIENEAYLDSDDFVILFRIASLERALFNNITYVVIE